MHECECCGVRMTNIGTCDPCTDAVAKGEGCDPWLTWHCFTAYCDGSGCSYPGECEE